MNRIEFYHKNDEYKALHHSAQNTKYYNKIDNYYPDGSARYFWSLAEWEAYEEGRKKLDS